MKTFLNIWELIEGTILTDEDIDNRLPDCLELDHLTQISRMLVNEGFTPSEFYVSEYPTEGVYCIQDKNKKNYFTVAHDESTNTLMPTYTTVAVDERGYNTFPCKTIVESIEKTEC